MKTLLTILATLLFCVPMAAQQTNSHVAGIIAASGSGFDAPILGVTAGRDMRKGRLVLSLDAAAMRAHKTLYKDGVQYDGTETLRFYFGKVCGQVGAVEQYNSFDRGQLTKTTIEPLLGLCVQPTMRYILGLNIRKDVTSENDQLVGQGYMQWWAAHHVYAKVSGALSNFRECTGKICGRATAGSVKVEVGVHF